MSTYSGIIARLEREHEQAIDRASALESELEAIRAAFRKADVLIGCFEEYLQPTDPVEDDFVESRRRLRELVRGFRRSTGTTSALERGDSEGT